MGRWSNEQIEQLKKLYEENYVPSDPLVKDKDALDKFTREFNKRVGPTADFTPKEVADQLFKLRKSGKLPKIRRR